MKKRSMIQNKYFPPEEIRKDSGDHVFVEDFILHALVKSRKPVFFLRKKIKITKKKYHFLYISSSYANILGEKLFRTREIP